MFFVFNMDPCERRAERWRARENVFMSVVKRGTPSRFPGRRGVSRSAKVHEECDFDLSSSEEAEGTFLHAAPIVAFGEVPRRDEEIDGLEPDADIIEEMRASMETREEDAGDAPRIAVSDLVASRGTGDVCPVCLSETDHGTEGLRGHQCTHVAHAECMREWTSEGPAATRGLCPTCRVPLARPED